MEEQDDNLRWLWKLWGLYKEAPVFSLSACIHRSHSFTSFASEGRRTTSGTVGLIIRGRSSRKLNMSGFGDES